ncbi:histidinol-phosphate transaminase [Leptospira sp. GIMC2001]|uniref:histidinol-phosphate transaminase n=1 Tax=Leptospira sp. GIMC2001 TaxID=1513297 RepID=UPI00234BC1A1|nr:histidinol-phosphate transaminase [Leptospira sp. GIMC2001]WCL50965.1 histidinol-phosphate transaminase [Leptospira sp. GIMC2001]
MNSYFRKDLIELTPYTPGEQPSGLQKIIKLNTNENPYPPSSKIKDSVLSILESGNLRKYPHPTSDGLRDAIAKLYGIDRDEIIITNGSDEAIRLLFTACLEKGDSILSPDPTYSAYPVYADITMQGIDHVQIPLLSNLLFDWEAMAKVKAKLCSFANPNAPTGILEPRESVLKFVQNFDGLVLCDEAYIDFASDSTSVIQEIQNYPNLLVSRTFSKSYSLAGLRVGFLCGNKELIALLHNLKDSYNVGMLDQEIARIAIEDQDYFKSCCKKIIETREYLSKELDKLGFLVIESSTNFIFAKPNTSLSAFDYFNELKRRNIYIRYFAKGIASEYIRITIGTLEETKILLDNIKEISLS